MDTPDDSWLDRVKAALAIDVARGISAGMTPDEIVAMLLNIPELMQALRMRADRRSLPPTVILTDAADYLDDGFHEKTVAQL